MATKTTTIHGITFEVAAPYAEGHVVNENEARSLNQTRAENVANGMRKKIETWLGEGRSEKEIQKEFKAYDSQYVFTAPRQRVARDPLTAEAWKIAREAVGNALKEQGLALTVPAEGWTKEDWKAMVDDETQNAIANTPEIMELAKQALEASKKKAKVELKALVK